ncbi:CBP3 [[Candida] subhashii]|uniref:CBP3 n=1 Tax=[Candida] subhashii TaxID=561895 RepID=A0A8J5QKN4_9ASCO|nr:CBP3 [[Candida] subhashii]KAG7663883.1 CBP3 [[Candida] subhashii]
MLRIGTRTRAIKSTALNLRSFTTSTILAKNSTTTTTPDSSSQDPLDAPMRIAEESTLPFVEHDLKIKPRQPKKKLPLLSEHKEENPDYKMSDFKQRIGQFVIDTLKLDMDKSRAGTVAGSVYFADCKVQGLIYPDEPLSDTAKFYYKTLRLPTSFAQQTQITFLHYWMLSVRMRAMPFKYGKLYQQRLVDRIFKDMELRMSSELGISSNRVIEGNLKDFHAQLIGSVLGYDEGLVTDDATLAAALWRNVFNGNPNVDMRHVEALLAYVRSQLYVLDKMSDREFGFGKFRFVPPNQVVKPITSHQLEIMRQKAKEEFAKLNSPSHKTVLSLDE